MANKKEEKKQKPINFPLKLHQQIEKYQTDNGLSSFTAATLELVRKGLEKKNN